MEGQQGYSGSASSGWQEQTWIRGYQMGNSWDEGDLHRLVFFIDDLTAWTDLQLDCLCQEC